MRDICEIEEKSQKKRPTVLSSSQLGHSLFSLSSLSDVETIDVESKFQLPRCIALPNRLAPNPLV